MEKTPLWYVRMEGYERYWDVVVPGEGQSAAILAAREAFEKDGVLCQDPIGGDLKDEDFIIRPAQSAAPRLFQVHKWEY